MKYYGDIDLQGGGYILNLKVEKVNSIPSFLAEDEARMIYFNKELYLNDGNEYISLNFPSSINNINNLLGNEWVNSDYTFKPSTFNTLNNVSNLTSDSSLFDVITQLDSAIKNYNNFKLDDLEDVTVPTNINNGNILYYNGSVYTFTNINQIITNYADLNLNIIKNIDFSNLQNNYIMVYNSTTEKYEFKKAFYNYEDLSSNTLHTVKHDLGQKYCLVQIIDRSTDTIIKDATITFLDQNTLTVELTTPTPINVVVSNLS